MASPTNEVPRSEGQAQRLKPPAQKGVRSNSNNRAQPMPRKDWVGVAEDQEQQSKPSGPSNAAKNKAYQ